MLNMFNNYQQYMDIVKNMDNTNFDQVNLKMIKNKSFINPNYINNLSMDVCFEEEEKEKNKKNMNEMKTDIITTVCLSTEKTKKRRRKRRRRKKQKISSITQPTTKKSIDNDDDDFIIEFTMNENDNIMFDNTINNLTELIIDSDIESSNSSTPRKKVRFATDENLCEIHYMIKWSYAYQTARKGPWELYARDRYRFYQRINHLEKILQPIMTKMHRQKIYDERFK